MIVDCKCWRDKVDVGDVERLLGLIVDVRAQMGVLITTSGASPAAEKRAGESVQIDIVPFDDLEKWWERMPVVTLTSGLSHGTLTYYIDGEWVSRVVERELAEKLLARLWSVDPPTHPGPSIGPVV